MLRRSKIFFLLCIICTMTACVTPQGDEYEKIYYDFMLSTKFRLAVIQTDGSLLREALMLPFNSEWDRMDVTYFTNQDQNIVIAKKDMSFLLHADDLTLIKSKSLNFTKIYESAVSPDGQQIVFCGKNKNSEMDLYLLNPTELDVTNLTNSPNSLERFPSFTPDGQHVVYTSIEFGNKQAIVMLNINTTTFDTLLSAPSPNSKPTDYDPIFVSPFVNISDSLLYYCQHSNHTLVSYSLKFKQSNPFYQNVYPWQPLDFTKDGQFVLFIGFSYPHQLMQFDLNQQRVSNIAKIEKTDKCDFALSDDGNKVAFTSIIQKDELNGVRSDYYDYYQLWLTNREGTDKKLMDSGRWPVFSGDGNMLAFYKAYYQADY